jgi:uncharacterized membrane protein YfhO
MKKLLLTVTILIAVVFGPIILFNQSIFVFYGDSYEMVLPFTQHFVDQIRSGTLSFWNPYMGIGASNVSNLINGLGSPFTWLIALFPVELTPYLILWSFILRTYITAVFAYLWFNKLFKNKDTSTILSLIYTFSGWALYFYIFSFYLDAYMYIAIVLYGSELVLEKRSSKWMLIGLIGVGIYSVYFLYITSFLLLIYHVFRHLVSDDQTLNAFFRKFIDLIIVYFQAILLAGVFIVPSILVLINSPRLSENELLSLNSFINLDKTRLFSIFTSHFSPGLNDFDPNILISRFKSMGNTIFYLFTSILSVLAITNLVWLRFKEKRILLLTLMILYLMTLSPLAHTLINGSQDVRWYLFHTIFILIGLGYFLENHTTAKIKILPAIGLFLSAIFISYYFNLHQWDRYLALYLLLSMGIMLSYYLLIKFKRQYLLIIVIMLELSLVTYLRLYEGPKAKYINGEIFMSDLNKYSDKQVFEGLIPGDQEFYRIDVVNAFSNDSIGLSYPSYTFYSSLYNHYSYEWIYERFSTNWNVGYNASKFLLKHHTGTKYFFSRNDNDLPPFGFEFYQTQEDWFIYRQDYPVLFGYASNQTIKNQFLPDSKFLRDILRFKGIFNEYKGSRMDLDSDVLTQLDIGLTNGFIDFSLFDEEGYFFLDYSPYHPAGDCQLDYYQNGTIVYQTQNPEYAYLSINRLNDYDGVFAYCRSMNNRNEYIPYDVYFMADSQIDNLYRTIEEYDELMPISVSNDKINARVNVKQEDSIVYTTIAYDPGWTVKIDGVQVDSFIVNEAFLGFEIDKGSHEIEMSFIPKGLWLGLTSTALTSIYMLTKFFLKKRKHS